MLLNSAFDVLRDPEKRSAYDASLHIDPHVEDDDDDGPTWPWTAKERRGEKVIYKGRPRSRSLWERVPDEDRGDRWEQQNVLPKVFAWMPTMCEPAPFTKPTHLPHLAEKWVERRRRDSEMARKRMALASKHFNVTMEQFQQQLRSAMLKLPPDLRQAAFS
eukprot:g28095.t1